MKKSKLIAATAAAKTEIQEALQTTYDALNSGQKKKIVKDEKVKSLFDRHGVKYDN